jgi:biopolymer transport protein ExbD
LVTANSEDLSLARNLLAVAVSNIAETMKPTFFRLGTLALSFVLGVILSLFFTSPHSDDSGLPPFVKRASPVVKQPSTECVGDELTNKGANVVISVPNDDEFYIGKQKVELSQISARITKLLGKVCPCDRVVFIKGAAKVKFETLDPIVRQAKIADVNRIEFVLDKKKRGR